MNHAQRLDFDTDPFRFHSTSEADVERHFATLGDDELPL